MAHRCIFLALALTVVTAAAKSMQTAPAKPSSSSREKLCKARRWAGEHLEELVHFAFIAYVAIEPTKSVRMDEWLAIRARPEVIEQKTTRTILRNRKRAAQIGQLVGGYTPRIVFLAGMSKRRRPAEHTHLLDPKLAAYDAHISLRSCLPVPLFCPVIRSLQMGTRLRYLFDPSSGYAAGSMLAAHYCQREWLPCLLLGWGVGGAYWSAFRVRPPGVAKGEVGLKFL